MIYKAGLDLEKNQSTFKVLIAFHRNAPKLIGFLSMLFFLNVGPRNNSLGHKL